MKFPAHTGDGMKCSNATFLISFSASMRFRVSSSGVTYFWGTVSRDVLYRAACTTTGCEKCIVRPPGCATSTTRSYVPGLDSYVTPASAYHRLPSPGENVTSCSCHLAVTFSGCPEIWRVNRQGAPLTRIIGCTVRFAGGFCSAAYDDD